MELFETLTVRENVALGREGSMAGARVLSQFAAPPTEQATVRANTEEALERCGLSAIADRHVASLSTGQRRLVEFARCLAGAYGIFLLDEPSAGLDRFETERFGEVLRAAASDRRIGVLLVEHDMSLVMASCDYIYVLDFGQLVFEGTPEEVRSSPIVREAYLGSGQDSSLDQVAETSRDRV
jgi:ABC-type branched-subunit amino acid transport system ATPase component